MRFALAAAFLEMADRGGSGGAQARRQRRREDEAGSIGTNGIDPSDFLPVI